MKSTSLDTKPAYIQVIVVNSFICRPFIIIIVLYPGMIYIQ